LLKSGAGYGDAALDAFTSDGVENIPTSYHLGIPESTNTSAIGGVANPLLEVLSFLLP